MARHPDVMRLDGLRRVLAFLALAAAPWPAAAFDGRCEAAVSGSPVVVTAAESVEAYAALSESCLKSMFLQCAEAADRGLLGPGSAMTCSVGYEALRRKVFRDDFEALLAWWRSTRPRD